MKVWLIWEATEPPTWHVCLSEERRDLTLKRAAPPGQWGEMILYEGDVQAVPTPPA